MKVVVVGGGIAGLAAARRLELVAPAAEIVLVESDSVLGGKLRTERVDGFVIEAAPDSFLSRKERGVGLVDELGLSEELIARRPEHHHTFVRRGADLHPLPEGLTGMIPTNLEALERSELLSPEGKLRFASEPDVPPAAGDEDESVGSFVARRFGREAYEALVEPLMTGIYGGDGDRLSLRATFPQLRVLELEHGSILRGLSAPPPSELPPFVSLRGGMGSLVSAVVDAFERTELLLGRGAARVSRSPEGYGLELVDGEVIEADGVVVATPAFVSAQLLADLDPELAAAHAEIPYASSVVVTLAFSRADVTPLDGYGYLVPRVDGADVLACTWTSQKWDGRAPDDSVLIRVYAGRFGGRDLTEDADDDLVALARAEVGLVGVVAEPVLTRVHRWPRRDAAVPPRSSGASRADRRRLVGAPGARLRGSGVPRRRDSRLHPLRRAGRGVGRASSRRSTGVTRETSERLFAEALDLLPGGVSSPVRAFKAVGGSPLFIDRGEGAYLVDVDGNRYVDYVLSWGPLILGHAHPRVVAALEEALRKGTSFGAPSPLELELARPHSRRDAEPRARPLRELGDGGDDERDSRRARLHAADEDRQVRRLLPRPRGSAPRAGGLGRRDARACRTRRA